VNEKYNQEIEVIERLVNNYKYREALDLLQALVNHNIEKSKQARTYYYIALCMQGLSIDYNRALDYYSFALENGFEPQFWVFYNRSLLYIQLGDLEAARIDIDKAVSLNPGHEVARQIQDDLLSPQETQSQIKLASPVVACCVGKSGTVLLANLLASILGDNQVIPSNFNLGEFINFRKPLVTSDHLLSMPRLTNRVYVGHIWYSDEIAKKLSSVPKIILIRDPRDNVVSYTHFMDRIAKDVFGSAEEYWNKKDWDEKLSSVIFGFKTVVAEIPSVYESYLNYGIRWAGPNAFVVRYEDIIGTKFGGNDKTVVKTMKSLMDFIGVQIDEVTLVRRIIQGSDPAKSQTFRSGGEGNWRHEFKPIHVSQMKAAAPKLVSSLGYEADETWDLNTKTKKRDFSEININTGCLLDTAPLDMTSYLQIRKESEGKRGVERTIDGWALKIFIEQKQYQDAVLISEQLFEHEPTNPFWNYFYAICLHELRKDPRKAIYHYNAALENGFNEFRIVFRRGQLFRDLDDFESARMDLQRAVNLDQKNSVAQELLRDVEQHLKFNKIREMVSNSEYQKASIQLEDLLNKFPTDAQLNYYYAFCLHRKKIDLNEALRYYDVALKNGFNEFWVRYNRGSLLAEAGDKQAAVADLERALALNPQNKAVQDLLIAIQAGGGDV
jgi:tetratricopeptide (TPR) repeat protein